MHYIDIQFEYKPVAAVIVAGALSAAWVEDANLQVLDVSHNSLSGALSGAWAEQAWPGLQTVDLSYNHMSGAKTARKRRSA